MNNGVSTTRPNRLFPRTEHPVQTLSNKAIADCGALIKHER